MAPNAAPTAVVVRFAAAPALRPRKGGERGELRRLRSAQRSPQEHLFGASEPPTPSQTHRNSVVNKARRKRIRSVRFQFALKNQDATFELNQWFSACAELNAGTSLGYAISGATAT